MAEPLAAITADAVVVGVYSDDKKLRDPAARVDQAAGGALRGVLDAEKFQGKVGHVTQQRHRELSTDHRRDLSDTLDLT